ncbi:hypothetical protein, partial [Streptococcus pneumoniae]|uniref:hypothetical protein n=1 Tax=Streptococcus pneumoniae TaxID=1313 RepID=UPI001E4FA9B1
QVPVPHHKPKQMPKHKPTKLQNHNQLTKPHKTQQTNHKPKQIKNPTPKQKGLLAIACSNQFGKSEPIFVKGETITKV